jgi:uncharacterized protein (DUF305 family)
MTRTTARTTAAGLLAVAFLAACSHATGAAQAGAAPAAQPAAHGTTPPAGAKPSTYHNDFSPADVAFMTDMIAHHGQATMIAAWAPTHGASDAVRTMAERIVVGQNDEIALMQNWLRDNGQPVPAHDTSAAHAMMPGMDHAGMDHAMMPGMLTAAQLATLDSARGPAFDRLFLTDMIHHHQGALAMVDKLFGTNGAGQNETVFRLASDIYADQSTEIDRMTKMLAAQPLQGSRP